MLQAKLKNANGYTSLEGYPFPVIVPVTADNKLTEFEKGEGLIKVSCNALRNAAPGWDAPSWWNDMDTLAFSSGDWFDTDARNGWQPVDTSPFAYWNAIKASRPVGAAW